MSRGLRLPWRSADVRSSVCREAMPLEGPSYTCSGVAFAPTFFPGRAPSEKQSRAARSGRTPRSHSPSNRSFADDSSGDTAVFRLGPDPSRGGRTDSLNPRATPRGRSRRSPASRCVILGGRARRDTQRRSPRRAGSSHQRRRRLRDRVCPRAEAARPRQNRRESAARA